MVFLKQNVFFANVIMSLLAFPLTLNAVNADELFDLAGEMMLVEKYCGWGEGRVANVTSYLRGDGVGETVSEETARDVYCNVGTKYEAGKDDGVGEYGGATTKYR